MSDPINQLIPEGIKGTPISAYHLWRMPEFIALMRKLGVDVSQPITSLSLSYSGPDSNVVLLVESMAVDMDKRSNTDTTCQHNEGIKTCRPAELKEDRA